MAVDITQAVAGGAPASLMAIYLILDKVKSKKSESAKSTGEVPTKQQIHNALVAKDIAEMKDLMEKLVDNGIKLTSLTERNFNHTDKLEKHFAEFLKDSDSAFKIVIKSLDSIEKTLEDS